jgi:3-oxoadipate enol-lactonase
MRLHYRFDGPAEAPVLALPSSLGTTTELWDANVPAWSETFRVLRYDQRGHGGSEVPPAPYSIEHLGRDFLSLLDELGIERVSFCGLSLGGATAMWLAANVPARIDGLVLGCTSPRFGDPDSWLDRAAIVRDRGLEAIADTVLERWFTARFAREHPEVPARFRELLVSTPREGYAGCCEALAGWDFRGELGQIEAPTLVIAGSEDTAAPPDQGRLIADRIPGGTLVVLQGAAHLGNVEPSDAFSSLVTEHLSTSILEVA